MCFSKPNVPNNTDDLVAQEAAREQKVAGTSAQVNQIFDQKFGPGYYAGIGDAYRSYMRPQVASQFRDAERATRLSTADIASSSAADREQAGLAKAQGQAQQDVESGAIGAQNQAKQDVENKRGSLINIAEAGGSLENTAAQARAAAATDIGRPTYSPVGTLFGQYMNTLSNAAIASNNGYNVNPFFQRQVDFLRGGPRGSSTTVG